MKEKTRLFLNRVIVLVVLAGLLCASAILVSLIWGLGEQPAGNGPEAGLVPLEERLMIPENSPNLYSDYPDGYCDFFAGDWIIDGEIFTIDPETCAGRNSIFSIKIDPNPNLPWYSSCAIFCGAFGCVAHPIRVEDGRMFDIFYGYFEAMRVQNEIL